METKSKKQKGVSRTIRQNLVGYSFILQTLLAFLSLFLFR